MKTRWVVLPHQETRVQFLIGANYGVGFKKISLTGQPGFGGFISFLMKTRGAVLPTGPSLTKAPLVYFVRGAEVLSQLGDSGLIPHCREL
jgi:hypothetical protein